MISAEIESRYYNDAAGLCQIVVLGMWSVGNLFVFKLIYDIMTFEMTVLWLMQLNLSVHQSFCVIQE